MLPGPRHNLFGTLDADTLLKLSDYFRDHAKEAREVGAVKLKRDRTRRQIERKLGNAETRPLTPKQRATMDRKLRDIEIMRMAQRGWTNRRIAEKFGLHEKSISRIVRREVKKDALMNGAQWPY